MIKIKNELRAINCPLSSFTQLYFFLYILLIEFIHDLGRTRQILHSFICFVIIYLLLLFIIMIIIVFFYVLSFRYFAVVVVVVIVNILFLHYVLLEHFFYVSFFLSRFFV